MFASLKRIDDPPGKEPIKTSAPSLPTKDWMRIETLGKDAPFLLLSITRTAPLSSERFFIVTVIFGFSWTIAVTLRLIIMLPCATTFENTTLEQDTLIVSLAAAIVELVRTHGTTPKVC